ncbi:MAG TPA: DUF58 domain-containing protein, partial [Polyangiales bacterium]|nr:DUF58 domain-containing protein [Polyangiales bacterium]
MRARGYAERALDLFPLTPLGLALGVCAYFALRKFAYEELDLVWLVTGYAALGLCALSPLFVLPCALYLRLRTRPAPVSDKAPDPLLLETAWPAETGYSLPSLRFVPFIQLRWHWVSPSAAEIRARRQGGTAHEVVTLAERGHHDFIERRLVIEDPFGLTRIAFRRRELRGASVLPRLGGLAHLSSLTALAAGSDLPHPMGLEDGDRLELTRYTPGDPARFIHWKVFARTRKLLVRRPERAVAVARRCAAFYVAGADDDASAAAARLALERKLLGNDWVFGTDLTVAGTTRVDEALAHLVESVHARDKQAQGLSAFLAQVESKGPASVLVFGPPVPGAWLSAVIRAASRRQLRAVIAVDGVADARVRPLWARLIARAAPVAGNEAQALDATLGILSRARIPVILLDRTTGRPLGERARRAL